MTQRYITLPMLAIALSYLLMPVPSPADDAAASLYRQGYRHVLDESWSEATRAMDDMLARFPDSEEADAAAFWSCYGGEKSGAIEAEQAFACYERLVRQRPASDWNDDAVRNLTRLSRQLQAAGKPEYRQRVQELGGSDGDDLPSVLLALAQIGDERSAQAVFDHLDRAEDPGLRARLVHILAEVDSPRALATLESLARNDPAPPVRMSALAVLAEQDEERFAAVAKEIIADPAVPPPARHFALQRLAETASDGATDMLVQVAAGDDLQTAQMALHLLAEIEGETALAALRSAFASNKSLELRRMALVALAERQGEEALDFLLEVAAGDEPELAQMAVWRLAEIESPRAFAALSRLAVSAGDRRLRVMALHALGQRDGAEAIAALTTVLEEADDPELRRAALHALIESDDAAAVELLRRTAKEDVDPSIRRMAIQILGEIGTDAAREALIGLIDTSES